MLTAGSCAIGFKARTAAAPLRYHLDIVGSLVWAPSIGLVTKGWFRISGRLKRARAPESVAECRQSYSQGALSGRVKHNESSVSRPQCAQSGAGRTGYAIFLIYLVRNGQVMVSDLPLEYTQGKWWAL